MKKYIIFLLIMLIFESCHYEDGLLLNIKLDNINTDNYTKILYSIQQSENNGVLIWVERDGGELPLDSSNYVLFLKPVDNDEFTGRIRIIGCSDGLEPMDYQSIDEEYEFNYTGGYDEGTIEVGKDCSDNLERFDCNETDSCVTTIPDMFCTQECVDNDGDNYGDGCVNGLDCDDNNYNCNLNCDDLNYDGIADCNFCPNNPQLLNSISTNDDINSIHIEDPYLYVASDIRPAIPGEGGELHIFNMLNIYNEFSSIETSGDAKSVFGNNYFAFVADSLSELQIFDLTYADIPKLLGSYNSGLKNYSGVFVYYHEVNNKDYAFISETASLLIIDVSVLDSPELVGSYFILNPSTNLFVNDYYVYIGGNDEVNGSQLKIIDVSDPENPQETGKFIPENGSFNDFYVVDNYAYLASPEEGLVIIDITNKVSPTFIGMSNSNGASNVVVKNNYAYISTNDNGVEIINVSDPYNPQSEGEYWSDGKIVDIDFQNGYIFIAVSNSESGQNLQTVSVLCNNNTIESDN